MLYDGHVSNYPTGCPRYIAFSTTERRKIAVEAKFCWFCHDPKYIYKNETAKKHKEDCYIQKGKKSKFTCTVKPCKVHMWICTKHREENKTALGKFKTEIENKHGLLFGYHVSFPVMTRASGQKSSFNSQRPENQFSRRDHILRGAGNVRLFDPPPPDVHVEEIAANCDCKVERSLSTAEAYEVLRKELNENGMPEELKPIPEGTAQYILALTEGKTRPILQLYDTGCGGVLFREGVPGKEIPAVPKTKGPFFVNGVGNSTVKVNDQWMYSFLMVLVSV